MFLLCGVKVHIFLSCEGNKDLLEVSAPLLCTHCHGNCHVTVSLGHMHCAHSLDNEKTANFSRNAGCSMYSKLSKKLIN